MLVLAGAASIGVVASGCGSLKVTKIAAATQRPANVAIYVDIHDTSGNAVPNLQEKNFRVYEDGKLLAPAKAKRALLEPRTFGVKYTLVLLDLSGPMVDSEDLPDLATTVGKFVEHLSDKQQVAVSVFDGNDEVAPFLGFGAEGDQIPGLVEGLRKFRPRNRNTNWNGAIYQGLHTLEEQLAASTVPEKSAALVVFTDRGNDLAHSVGVDTMKQKVKDSPVPIFVIGIGEKINKPELNAIGRNGVFLSSNLKAYKKGFEEVSQKLTADTDGRYVFSYCSPKRKGDHKAEVEILAPVGQGKITYRFNAAGFKNGCSPKHRPTFSGEDKKPTPPPPPAPPPAEEEEEAPKPQKPARPEKPEKPESSDEPEEAPAKPAKPSPPRPAKQAQDKE